jgi:hypothetical protein
MMPRRAARVAHAKRRDDTNNRDESHAAAMTLPFPLVRIIELPSGLLILNFFLEEAIEVDEGVSEKAV